MSDLFLGYDPGSGGKHGVAAITDGRARCTTVLTAECAIEWLVERCVDQKPSAVGIDALTLWSTGPAGWRPADRWLRANYRSVAASIVAPNSLHGAMAINGVAVALELCRMFPALRITETHPKILYFALTGSVYDFTVRRDKMVQDLRTWLTEACEIDSEHSWDALLSAYAARQWELGEWQLDLHRLPSQPGERLIPAHGSEPFYAWPKPGAARAEGRLAKDS